MKAVAFDLWETLITDSPEAARLQEERRLRRLGELLAEARLELEPGQVEAAYRHTWNRCWELYWSRDRDIPSRTQIVHLLEQLVSDPAQLGEPLIEALEEAYVAAAAETLPSPVEGALSAIEGLRGRYRLGLVCNTGRTPGRVLRAVLQQLGMIDAFEVMVFSNEHGECKPLGSIFARLHEGLGVPAPETVFVGDNLYSDVWGAQQAGMRAVHFDPPVRGHAVGPATREVGPVTPDATIRSLSELPAVLERWSR